MTIDFVKHFSSMANEAERPLTPDNINDNIPEPTINIEQLDSPIITIDEVKKTVSKLKRNKSCDIENNVAEFFIDANDVMSSYLCEIFNYIFDNCIYPSAWSKGVIVPLYKKGDRNDPSNYRGITWVNIIGKIFSLLLRNRINKWCEDKNILNDSQFGFREGRSTCDAIFVLHTIIQKVLSKRKKLWCIFIDYQRAFDTVDRDALWVRLLQSGVSCKMIDMIKCIYNVVQSCVKLTSKSELSTFFDVSIGLKQDEPLSPLLFLFFYQRYYQRH